MATNPNAWIYFLTAQAACLQTPNIIAAVAVPNADPLWRLTKACTAAVVLNLVVALPAASWLLKRVPQNDWRYDLAMWSPTAAVGLVSALIFYAYPE